VVHYIGDRRQRKTFADLGLAVTEAEVTANKLSAGELDVLTLTSQDRLAYIRAIEVLRPTGVGLEMAALQFAEALKVMDGGSILDAARFIPGKTLTTSRANSFQTFWQNCSRPNRPME